MNRPLGELAKLVEGQLSGDAGTEVTGAATIACSTSTDITFASSQKHIEAFYASAATAAIVDAKLELTDRPENKHIIAVENPDASFAKIVAEFRPPVQRKKIGISPRAIISDSAKIADDVDIHAGAVIGDNVEIGCGTTIFPNVSILERCVIGTNVTIFPSAVLYEDTVVGDRSIIHGGVVLGAYGFGYKTESGQHKLSAQLGNVVIGCDVEIGANSTIDRGTFDSTTIGDGSKLDDAVMIGHNCQIGKHNLICSQVGIAGSCKTGDFVVMAGQVGVGDHLEIGDGATLFAKAGIMNDVEPNATLFGAPAKPVRETMQIIAASAKLPEMRKQIKRLIKKMEQLESLQNSAQTLAQESKLAQASQTSCESESKPASIRKHDAA